MFDRISKISPARLRNFVFGVEDSVVSTVGFLSGIAAAGADRGTIFLNGIVLIFVEAFSMAVGSFLSERSAEEYAARSEVSAAGPIRDSIVMFFSYFISGFVPLFPYFIAPVSIAFWLSIVLSLLILFILGVGGARLSRLRGMRRGIRMLLVGGAAIAIGILVGKITRPPSGL